MTDLKDLSDIQKDALKEIGNIGAGNAATAFAQFLDCKIDMNVPSVQILPLSEVPEATGGIEQMVVGILLNVMGEAPGRILLILPEESIKILLPVILKREVNINEIDEIGISAIKEIGNILSGSYLNAMNHMINFNLVQSVPSFAYDIAGAVLSTSMIPFGESSDYALLIETKFFKDNSELEGYFFFIPDPGSLNKILATLGFDNE